MSAADVAGERLQELLGPVFVKEVRQGLRGRVFTVSFGLLLLACFVAALVAFGEASDGRAWQLGERYATLFLGALGVVEFFVIPLGAHRAMVKEREDDTWVLLVLTGLGAPRVVRGKVASALSQGLLYASAGAPFVLFSYYLNGVSIPVVLVALLLSCAWSVFLVALAVALGTQGATRLGRTSGTFTMMGLLALGTFVGIAVLAALVDEGERLLARDAFLVTTAVATYVALTSAVLLVEGAAASLALPTESAAKGPRRMLAVQVLLGVGCGAAAVLVADGEKAAATVGSALTALLVLPSGVLLAAERDGCPRGLAHLPWWQRPGALRSFVLVLLLLLVSTAVWAAVFPSLGGGTHQGRLLRALFAGPAYVALYLSLGVLWGRWTPLRRLGEPVASRVGFLLALTLGNLVPALLSVVDRRSGWTEVAVALSPLAGMLKHLERYRGAEGTEALAALLACTAAAVALALLALWRRDGVRQP